MCNMVSHTELVKMHSCGRGDEVVKLAKTYLWR
jgi:hypothetical protein